MHYVVYRKLPQVVRILLGYGIDENFRNMVNSGSNLRGIIAAELIDEDDFSKEAIDIRELLANADSLRKNGSLVKGSEPAATVLIKPADGESAGSQTFLTPSQIREQKDAQSKGQTAPLSSSITANSNPNQMGVGSQGQTQSQTLAGNQKVPQLPSLTDITHPLPPVIIPAPSNSVEIIDKQPDLPTPSIPAFGGGVL